MPRLMSFRKTVQQVKKRTKTVTRRKGWEWLDEGTVLEPVVQAMGLKKGETVDRIFGGDGFIRVTDVRREPLEAMICETCLGHGGVEGEEVPREEWSERSNLLVPEPGRRIEIIDCEACDGTGTSPPGEARREGFPEMVGLEFVEFFKFEMGVDPADEVTRIEFEYIGGDG